MSDDHDDDGLSQLFGPPGETGQQPQQRPAQPSAAEPTEQGGQPPASEPAPPSWEQPTTAIPSWEQPAPATPSWEQPTTAMPTHDAPAAEPAPVESAPDPLAWLLAGQQAAPTPVAEPPAPTAAFPPATTPYGAQPPAYGPSSADPFGVASAAAGLGVGAGAEDLATRRLEPQAAEGGTGGPEGPGPNRRLFIILGVIGGVLLLAIIVLGIVLLTRGSGPSPEPSPSHSASVSPTPSATPSRTPSQTPSASPTPTPTPTPTPPPPPAPSVSAQVDQQPDCKTDPTNTKAPFTITYNSSNASLVKLQSGSTLVAQEAPPAPFPALQYDCTATTAPSYTVTAVGPGGTSQPVAVPVTPTK